MRLDDLTTPALVLDRAVLIANPTAMTARLRRLGVALRPHLKTAKSAHVARLALAGNGGGITVSTLREAAYFLDNGIADIVYAVGITPARLDAGAALVDRGAELKIVTDNGIVYMMGLLTQAEATRAANLVQSVSGVQKIVKLFEYID